MKQTLNKALQSAKSKNNIILHSDRGTIYISDAYHQFCKDNGFLVSHSRKGNPLDNAPIESFFSLLKKEACYNHVFTSMKEYVTKIKE